MTCREYAESEKLGAWRTLRYWAWRIEREQRAARTTKLVRVVREPDPVVVESEAAAPAEIEMRLVVSHDAVRFEVARKDLARVLDGLAFAMRSLAAAKDSA